jgi:hypothetical protein
MLRFWKNIVRFWKKAVVFSREIFRRRGLEDFWPGLGGFEPRTGKTNQMELEEKGGATQENFGGQGEPL